MSKLLRALDASAHLLAERWQVPAERRPAFVDTARSVMRGEVARLCGGENVYSATSSAEQRHARQGRILDALDRNERPEDIARRERVTPQWVRKLRASKLLRVESFAPTDQDAGIQTAGGACHDHTSDDAANPQG